MIMWEKECIHVYVTGSQCCTVEKKIMYWGNLKKNTEKIQLVKSTTLRMKCQEIKIELFLKWI